MKKHGLNELREMFLSFFETKDHLLRALCSDIFDHIFEGEACGYKSDSDSLEDKLTHILWHLCEHKRDVCGLLSSESGEIFMQYMCGYLTTLFEIHASDFHTQAPSDFLINHLTGAFVNTIKWWVKEKMQTPPDLTAHYFMSVVETHK